jgi:biotin carboxylase
MKKDIVISIGVVEPGLVHAVKLLREELGQPLKCIVLVDKAFANYPNRPMDTTGLFEEIVVDFNDADALQQIIKPLSERILLVTTRYEPAIGDLRKLIPFVPYVQTPTETSLLWASEKPLMRDRLKTYDEKLVPKYERIGEKDLPRWQEVTENLTYPVIVKPASLWSSLLVTRCENEQDLGDCLEMTFRVIREIYDREVRSVEPLVLVEEIMEGDMYSTDAYVSASGEIECLPPVQVLTAASVGLDGLYGYRCIVPTSLSETEVTKAFDAAKASIRALNLRSTTAHVEMFQTKDGWKIIELGARIGGYREGLYREAYGIEHHYNDLLNRIGMPTKIARAVVRHARAENILSEEEGIIEAIEGLDEASELESVISIEAHAKPGDIALTASNGGDLIVDALLSNADLQKLEADVAALRKLIKIKVRRTDVENSEELAANAERRVAEVVA